MIKRNWGYLLLIILAFVIPAFIKNDYVIYVLVLCAINVILTSSLRAVGNTGQTSLGHAAFMGVGAYTSALLVIKAGLSTYLSLLLGGLAAMAIAAIIAYPITRVKTVYFAMLTMFFGVVMTLVISEWRSMTNGTSGIIGVPPLDTISLFGLSIDFNNKLPNYYFALILMLIILLFLYSLDRSYIGRTLKAISQDDALAASTGINVARYKVIIFCLGCFIAGLAGGVYGHFISVLVPGSFGIFQSIYLLIYMIVGGTKRFGGAIIGATILTIIPELSRVLQEYQPFVFVAVLYGVVFFLPGGLVDLPRQIRLRLRFLNREKAKTYAAN